MAEVARAQSSFPAYADGITPGLDVHLGGNFDDMSFFATALTRIIATI